MSIHATHYTDAVGGGFFAARFFAFPAALFPVGHDSTRTDLLELSMAGYDCIPLAPLPFLLFGF